jgi:hypothetical protein
MGVLLLHHDLISNFIFRSHSPFLVVPGFHVFCSMVEQGEGLFLSICHSLLVSHCRFVECASGWCGIPYWMSPIV